MAVTSTTQTQTQTQTPEQPKTQSALIGGPNGDIILSRSVLVPQEPLRDHELAVAVKAISINPVDTKMTGPYHTKGAILGCDCAGVVTAVGKTAAADWGFKEGDRVTATVIGLNSLRPSVGAFAENTVCATWAALKIPDDWSFSEAAGGMGGLAWITTSWALFHDMGLPAGPTLEPLNSRLRPSHQPVPRFNIVTAHNPGDGSQPVTPVLVSGGASYTGTAAIQLLKLAGFNVIATCSRRSFDVARSFGADATFDYASPTVAEDIRAYTGNRLRLAIDCVTTQDSSRLCYSALGRAGGRYVALDPYSDAVAATRAVVRASWVFGLEPIGDEIAWPAPHSRKPNSVAKEFLQVWNTTMQGLVDRKLIRFHPQLVRNDGLAGALEGLDDIRSKRVTGKKLIYSLDTL